MQSSNSSEKIREPVTAVWMCLGCDEEKEISYEEMKQHWREIHGFDESTKSQTEMKDHFDSTTIYEWIVGDLKFLQFITVNRMRRKRT